MTPSDKELAIALAEKLEEEVSHDLYSANNVAVNGIWKSVDDYLSDKAWEILKSEGMAQKISEYVIDIVEGNESCNVYRSFHEWVACYDNNGTLTPRKIIEVFISMEDE